MAGALLAILGVLGVQLLVPAIDVEPLPRVQPYAYESTAQSVNDVITALDLKGELRPNMTALEMMQLAVTKSILREVPNFLWDGKPLTEARTPGNVSLRHEGGKTWFCAYDPTGKERRLLLNFGRPK